MKKVIFAACVIVLCCLLLTVVINSLDIFKHNPFDSYTRQAISWHNGISYLDEKAENVAYLELAFFNEKIYVSFPPVPSIIEYVAVMIWGQNTPNLLPLYFYTAASAVLLCAAFKRKKQTTAVALLFGLMCSIGTNLLSVITFGGVWHEAQGLSFFLCSLSVFLITGKSRAGMYFSLFFAALAVGCRPFTAFFIPVLLYEIYLRVKDEKQGIVKALPMLIAPACVAFALMLYNYSRFGNPLEFGHNYLPEFMREENGQFSIAYLGKNLLECMRLPQFTGENIFLPTGLEFNLFTATAFYLVNPAILIFMVYNIFNLINRRDAYDCIFIVAFVVTIIVTCMHKTLGGCQFGARYFIDMIPFLALYLSKQKLKIGVFEVLLFIFAVALNIYGTTLITVNFL